MTIPDDDAVGAPEVSLTTDLAKTLARLVQFAVAALEDCDAGGVTVLRGAGAITIAATDRFAIALDEVQYAANDGPCLDAARLRRTNVIESTLREPRWPRFCREAAGLGLHSALAVPLHANDEPIGALNLYSRVTDAFDEPAVATATIVASQASTAITDARPRA